MQANLQLFLDMLIPWAMGTEGEAVVFDPLTPKARHIESSPADRAKNFRQNLESHVFAPIIGLGEAGVDKLMEICKTLHDVVHDASDTDHIAELYDGALDELDMLCRTLPAIASREYGVLGSSEADVSRFVEAAASGEGLLACVKQNAFYYKMLMEHEKAAPTISRLMPKIAVVMQNIEAGDKTGVPLKVAEATEACLLLAEAEVGLRPTQADALQVAAKPAVERAMAIVLEKLKLGDAELALATQAEELTKASTRVFGDIEQAQCMKSAIASLTHRVGQEQQFTDLVNACSAWREASERDEKTALDELGKVKAIASTMKGVVPRTAGVTKEVRDTSESIYNKVMDMQDFGKGPLREEFGNLMLRLVTMDALASLAPAPGDGEDKEKALASLVLAQQVSLESVIVYFELGGESAEARVSADKGTLKAREAVAAMTQCEAAWQGQPVTPCLRDLLQRARACVDESAEYDLAKQMDKVKSSIASLRVLGAGPDVQPWHADFTGETFDELYAHAKTTVMSEDPKDTEQALNKVKSVFKAWCFSVESYGKDAQHTAFTEQARQWLSTAEVAFTSCILFDVLLVEATQPLKLRRSLRKVRDKLGEEKWPHVHLLLRENVEPKLRWQRAKNAPK